MGAPRTHCLDRAEVILVAPDLDDKDLVTPVERRPLVVRAFVERRVRVVDYDEPALVVDRIGKLLAAVLMGAAKPLDAEDKAIRVAGRPWDGGELA